MNATQNVGEWVPLELRNLSDGIGVEGLAFNEVGLQVTYQKPGGSVTVFTPTVDQWREGHLGSYQVFLTDAILSDIGTLIYWVTYTDALDYTGWVEVYTAQPDYSIGAATYISGMRARGVTVDDISDVDLTSVIGEALFEYSRFRPLIADRTFETIEDQQKYTWTQAGDASGSMVITCLWNPSGVDVDVFDYRRWIIGYGLAYSGESDWHYPSLAVVDDIKNAEWTKRTQGTGTQVDLEGGDIYLNPCPTESGITVYLLYTKVHATSATVKTSDRDLFLDLVEALCAGRQANVVSPVSGASDIKTPEYEIKGNSTYKYWVERESKLRQRFINKVNAGCAAVGRT